MAAIWLTYVSASPPGSELGRALPLVSELWRKEDLRKLASLSALENRKVP